MSAESRPTLKSSRPRSWRPFLFQEWGLLLLAAALAWIIYDNARGQVIVAHTITPPLGVEVRVEQKYRDRVAAVITDNDKISLGIQCSKREKDEEIVPVLKKNGWKIGLVVYDLPKGKSQSLESAMNSIVRYEWPFSEERLLPKPGRHPTGQVFRIEQRQVAVSRPPLRMTSGKTPEEEGLHVEVQLNPPLANLVLPVESTATDLTPDPIDLSALIEAPDFKYDTPLAVAIPLSFGAWREEKAQQDWERVYRQRLEVPLVTATLTVSQVGTRAITNRLVVMLSAQDYEYEFPRSVPTVPAAGALVLTGTLRARNDVLDKLEAESRSPNPRWTWGVRITDPERLPTGKPEPGKEKEWTEVSAEIVLLLSGEFTDSGVRFERERGMDVFDLKVRWHPDHD